MNASPFECVVITRTSGVEVDRVQYCTVCVRTCGDSAIDTSALSEFYDSAKGREWTNGTNWKDEYASFCDWKGVTCNDGRNHVTKINLSNNGLSGRLSKSIGNLIFIKELDLSDNDIKVKWINF